MEKLYKQLEESVIKLKAEIKLTFFYTIITSFIVIGFSFILFFLLLQNFQDTLSDQTYGVDTKMAEVIFEKTKSTILDRIILADSIIILFVIFAGLYLTSKTLKPIRENTLKQKRFVADASHEMRTPISIVISGLEVALRNKNLSLEDAKKTIQNSLEEMREFSQLSNALLDLSKQDLHKESKKEIFNISQLVNKVGEKMQNMAKEKSINLQVFANGEMQILGNKLEIERVIQNILNNAITHTTQNGNIKITENKISGRYVLEITDDGIGISPETLSKIFDPFFRGNTSRNTNGAGLGLTLAKKIIENHDGEIKIESEISKGTKVKISLPDLNS